MPRDVAILPLKYLKNQAYHCYTVDLIQICQPFGTFVLQLLRLIQTELCNNFKTCLATSSVAHTVLDNRIQQCFKLHNTIQD